MTAKMKTVSSPTLWQEEGSNPRYSPLPYSERRQLLYRQPVPWRWIQGTEFHCVSIQDFNRAGFRRVAADEAFLLQTVQMAVNRRTGGQADRFTDLADGRRIAFLRTSVLMNSSIACCALESFDTVITPFTGSSLCQIITQNRSSYKHKFEFLLIYIHHGLSNFFIFLIDTNVCSYYDITRTNVWGMYLWLQ